MKTSHARSYVPKEQLPVLLEGSKAPLWWAMILLLTIESAVFATMIAAYYYFRFTDPTGWPPAGIDPPDLLLPTLNSLVLFASSAVVYWGDHGIRQGDERRLKIGIVSGIVLGLIFVALKIYEYWDVGYTWDTHAYGSIIWMIIIFHTAHVVAVVMKGCVMAVLAFRGYFTGKRHLGVEINGVYWHFVALVWIPLFFTIYIVPRFF
jgi:cytochrome c oxidase subunit III